MKHFIICALAALFTATVSSAAVPDITELPEVTELTQGGITWTFSRPVRSGQFVNGDYYVVGPCTVITISPLPILDSVTTTNSRNGSILNPPAESNYGYDGRAKLSGFKLALMARLPVRMQPTDQLVSSISAANLQGTCFMNIRGLNSYAKTYSILTCTDGPVATDAFRPGMCDRNANLYYADSLKWNRLQNLAKVPTTPDIATWAGYFRQPWAGIRRLCYAGAQDYQPQYSVETVRAEAIASLLLNLDFTQAEKRDLLINFVQFGIDRFSLIRDGGYTLGWKAVGGHGNGNKWGITFAGIMLGEYDMSHLNEVFPAVRFGQDMQTAMTADMPAGMQTCWNGSNVVYTGHYGMWNGAPTGTDPAHVPYEHLHPSQWYASTYTYWGTDTRTRFAGETYRRGQNSPAWVGAALAIRIMGAEEEYGHDAFCNYVDRWMTIDDGPLADTINAYRHPDDVVDYRDNPAGNAFDPFVIFTWRFHRGTIPGSSGISPVPADQGSLSPLPFLFPNPVEGGRPVRFNGTDRGISIADRMGRVIFRSTAPGGSSIIWNGLHADGTPPAPGIYIISSDAAAASLLIN